MGGRGRRSAPILAGGWEEGGLEEGGLEGGGLEEGGLEGGGLEGGGGGRVEGGWGPVDTFGFRPDFNC